MRLEGHIHRLTFLQAAETIPHLPFLSDSRSRRLWNGPQWERFTGMADAYSRGLGWIEALHADDRESGMNAITQSGGQGRYEVMYRIREAATGNYRWHITRAVRRDMSGAPTRWVGTSTEIHELRVESEDRKEQLAEARHRSGNFITFVRNVVSQTLSSATSLEEVTVLCESRLRAMDVVQSLLASHAPSVELGALVESVMAAAMPVVPPTAVIDGPAIALKKSVAPLLALAIHELAANAIRFGALSQADGKLSVIWRVNADAQSRHMLFIGWHEDGVTPESNALDPRGFARELIEKALPYTLHAQTSLKRQRDGLSCSIVLPMSEVSCG